MKLTRLISAASLIAFAAPLAAQDSLTTPPSQITTKEIDAYLRFLSSDLLEGRAPGTRGGRLAAEYIASQLQAFGLKPGAADSTYYQKVPIDIVKSDPQSISVKATGKANASLVSPNDVIIWAGSASPASAAKGELVFVGYGATAPEYKWDDFKNVDVRGKVLLVLVNDPPAPASEPNLFGGKAMTYYGRWTYKYEEAERRALLECSSSTVRFRRVIRGRSSSHPTSAHTGCFRAIRSSLRRWRSAAGYRTAPRWRCSPRRDWISRS